MTSVDVQFTDQSLPGPSGPITAWSWDFGDGGTSTSESPLHTYTSPGYMTVKLEITGTSPDGTAQTTITIPIEETSSFFAITSFDRPFNVGDATRLVTFSTQAGLTNAINNMQPGDYILYSGTGVLVISTTSASTAYSISGKNLSSIAAIDFGTAHSAWGFSTTSNYVKFEQNATSKNGNSALSIGNCSNLAVYGGEFTSTAIGVSMRGALTNFYLLDQWIHDVGEHGVLMIPSTSSGGVSTIQSTTVRVEVGPNWCMNPELDTATGHTDLGSGIHCLIAFDSGNGSSFRNNTLVVYGHDSLAPGTHSYGVTWTGGGGGSVIEIGQSTGVGSADGSGNTLYVLGENNLFIPGENPGSTGTQTGGNVVNMWGNIPLNALKFGWIEGNNITGTLPHCAPGGSWHSVSTPIVVDHGRHSNTNQSTRGGNGAPNNVAYPTGFGIEYFDNT